VDDWGESGGGPPHSKTLADVRRGPANAKRLGVRQSSGALGRADVAADVNRLIILRAVFGWPVGTNAVPKYVGDDVRSL
jgi:hypothetical protein